MGERLPARLGVVPVGALSLGRDLVTTAGVWTSGDGAARFTPRFPPAPGTAFAVVGADSPETVWSEVARVVVPAVEVVSTTAVERIDPSVDEVPANLLRFSVTFSATMEEGSAEGHVHVLDGAGAELPGTLLDVPPELWDRARRRLTVLIEPGRIKRGLQPNVQAGAPLREGETVILLVDAAMRDAGGAALASEARRRYRVGPALRARVDPARWEVRWPRASGDALEVVFDRPLDRALVQRCLSVADEAGAVLSGRVSLDDGARRWTFTPEAGGRTGQLRIDTRLEDLAGNSVRRVFDRDLESRADDGVDSPEIVITREALGPPETTA